MLGNKTVIKIHSTICGEHQTSLKLRYNYNLMDSKKRRMSPFEFLLAPGSLVGNIHMEITLPENIPFRHNLRQSLAPKCASATDRQTLRDSFKRRASCQTGRLPPSVYQRHERNKIVINLDEAQQKEFNEQLGIKRWISTRLFADASVKSVDESESVSGFTFPVYDGPSAPCKALIVSIKV